MNKKVYVQNSIILYCCLLLFLTIMSLCVYAVVTLVTQGINSFLKWIYLFFAIVVFLFMTYTFIRFARNRIILNQNEIYVPKNWGNKKQIIQFETHIKYEEISDIYLVMSTNNSLNKESKCLFTPMPYIVFECDNGIQKAINVYFYSKKQVVNIIDETIKRAKAVNNNRLLKGGNQILLDFIKLKK